jgi:hypothetical protein
MTRRKVQDLLIYCHDWLYSTLNPVLPVVILCVLASHRTGIFLHVLAGHWVSNF